MDEDQLEDTATPLMKEDAVLQYFQENWTTNPKKLKKMALRLMPNVPDFVQRGFIHDVLTAHDPAKYIIKCLDDMDAYRVIIKDLIEAGHHGMIVINDVITPITIDSRSNWLRPGDPWHIDDEIEIQHKLCRAHMREHGMKRFHGKIVIFPAFGFSGITRVIGPNFYLEG